MSEVEDAPPPPSFQQFVHAWNASLELKTPKHHGDIADWLASNAAAERHRLLLMAFRGAGKSTVVGLFAAWLLCADPNRRLMVIAADLRLARKMVRNVQRIIERHPDTQGLKPAKAAQWGADEFTVTRRLELRDPSMLARSVGANFTGSRADVVICDDVEVPATCDSAVKRADLREALSEIDFVLVPGGLQLYVGTPHSYYSLYAAEARVESGETRPFLDGFDRFVLPVWDDKQRPAWPERFTVEHIRQLRKRHGEARFKAHML
ncbi:MAG TPA: phage terminase large subunit, partial [Azospirillaceae bacterium]|nr:phage terminase large subunit [Azospirillaceae bacterium]